MGRTNYIYIDFENVQDVDLERIRGKPIKLRLILGEQNKKLPVALVKKIHQLASQVELVETPAAGKNALDFVLAFEIGMEVQKNSEGYFHVLSRDKGFDVLIQHLKKKDIHAARHGSLNEIPLLMNEVERAKSLAIHYRKHPDNRPKKVKTLESQIQSFSGGSLSSEDIKAAIDELVRQKIISLSEKDLVAYL